MIFGLVFRLHKSPLWIICLPQRRMGLLMPRTEIKPTIECVAEEPLTTPLHAPSYFTLNLFKTPISEKLLDGFPPIQSVVVWKSTFDLVSNEQKRQEIHPVGSKNRSLSPHLTDSKMGVSSIVRIINTLRNKDFILIFLLSVTWTLAILCASFTTTEAKKFSVT